MEERLLAYVKLFLEEYVARAEGRTPREIPVEEVIPLLPSPAERRVLLDLLVGLTVDQELEQDVVDGLNTISRGVEKFEADMN